jgi:hypothetical protein
VGLNQVHEVYSGALVKLVCVHKKGTQELRSGCVRGRGEKGSRAYSKAHGECL